jgi:hypothetical protein
MEYIYIYMENGTFIDHEHYLVGALEPWNFMTFHSVGNGITIPTDFHSIIFRRGWYTTNQFVFAGCVSCIYGYGAIIYLKNMEIETKLQMYLCVLCISIVYTYLLCHIIYIYNIVCYILYTYSTIYIYTYIVLLYIYTLYTHSVKL